MSNPTMAPASGADQVLPAGLCARLITAAELAMRTHAACVEAAPGTRSLFLSGLDGNWDLDLVLLARPGRPGIHADIEAARPGSLARVILTVTWDGSGRYRDEQGAGCKDVIAALEAAATRLPLPATRKPVEL